MPGITAVRRQELEEQVFKFQESLVCIVSLVSEQLRAGGRTPA
jgi:hypothetical protein